jgi:GTP-binding protein
VHLLDAAGDNPLGAFHTVNAELKAFNPAIADRPQIVVLNKLDLLDPKGSVVKALKAKLARSGYTDVWVISAATTQGMTELLRHVRDQLNALPKPEPMPEPVTVIRPIPVDADWFEAERVPGGFKVTGTRVERMAAMTNWESEDAIARFQRILEGMGVKRRLRELEVADGDTVAIGDVVELEWVE